MGSGDVGASLLSQPIQLFLPPLGFMVANSFKPLILSVKSLIFHDYFLTR